MQSATRRLLLGLGVASVTALVFGFVFAAGLGIAASIAAGALIGGIAASVAAFPAAGRADPSATTTVPAGSALQPAAETDGLSRLRHDLRGVLSPALLTADRLLASSDDPAVRRAAETMIETVERATALLTPPKQTVRD